MFKFFLKFLESKRKRKRFQRIERHLRSGGDLDELIRRLREF